MVLESAFPNLGNRVTTASHFLRATLWQTPIKNSSDYPARRSCDGLFWQASFNASTSTLFLSKKESHSRMLARVVPISKMTILWNSLVISDWWSRFLKIPLASNPAFLQFHLLAIPLFGTPAFLLVIPLIYDPSYRQSHFRLPVTCQSMKKV